MSVQPLLNLLAALRHPQKGCPWDRKQTPLSLCVGILDEAFELLEAIERNKPAQVEEELGDLLFQLMFVISLYAESGHFTMEDVVKGIEAKMVRRHPHVFGNEKASDAGQVLKRWEEIKLGEGKEGHPLDSVPLALPALARARRLWHKASRLNWVGSSTGNDAAELTSLMAEVLQNKQPAQYGELLFKLAIWGAGQGLQAEELLREANRLFQKKVKSEHPA